MSDFETQFEDRLLELALFETLGEECPPDLIEQSIERHEDVSASDDESEATWRMKNAKRTPKLSRTLSPAPLRVTGLEDNSSRQRPTKLYWSAGLAAACLFVGLGVFFALQDNSTTSTDTNTGFVATGNGQDDTEPKTDTTPETYTPPTPILPETIIAVGEVAWEQQGSDIKLVSGWFLLEPDAPLVRIKSDELATIDGRVLVSIQKTPPTTEAITAALTELEVLGISLDENRCISCRNPKSWSPGKHFSGFIFSGSIVWNGMLFYAPVTPG